MLTDVMGRDLPQLRRRTSCRAWALTLAFAGVLPWAFCGLPRGRVAVSTARLAKGFGAESEKEEQDLKETEGDMMVELFKMIQKEEDKEDWAEPIVKLPGPLRPPAAPAKYKALTKIRLRVAPHSLADLTTPTYTIQPGQEFYVVAEQEHEEAPNVLWLRTDQDAGGAWLLERGVAGAFANKKVVRRIAGTLGATKRPPLMEISEVPTELAEEAAELALEAEALPPLPSNQKKREEREEFAGVNMQPPSPYERRQPILELLEDPEIQAVCKEMGADMETLRKNPAFIEEIARQLYGDEVVS
ncbi:unnamed protein product [Symbiodinium sp. CCMP2592]|nr:unnamed protein product [Symbiodinium sp. CCMP2592]